MKNKKGFTIIELGVSICLVTVVSFLLFQMITTVKKLYTSGDTKTTLLTKQAIMTKKIYDEFDQKILTQINHCDDGQLSCLKFVFSDSTTSVLLVDPLNNVVSYNNYNINYDDIDDTITFGALVLKEKIDFFTIKIPITSNTVNGDYGIFITKQHDNYIVNSYNTDDTGITSITVPVYNENGDIATTSITKDGSDYWMRVYDADNTTLNNVISSKLKKLKIDTCSASGMTGNIYELKTGNNSSRWCQNNNFYTQNVGTYKNVAGTVNTALGKSTYKDALTADSTLSATTLDLKVNAYVERYTFKSR